MDVLDKKDVFISYRRDGGATVARLLCEVLRSKGVNVFFDTESLGSGEFDKKIEQELEKADNFLFIVSPNVFEKCHDKNNWVRKEIELALDKKGTEKIIPVFVNGVTEFPDDLPVSMNKIVNINGLKLDHEHFNTSINELISRFVSRRHILMNSFHEIVANIDTDQSETKLINLIKVCCELCDPEEYDEMVKMLVDKIRLVSENDTNDKLLNSLLNNNDLDFSKTLCDKLGLDNVGTKKTITLNIRKWLSKERSYLRNENTDENQTKEVAGLKLKLEDHYYKFINAFVSISDSELKGYIKNLAEGLDIELEDKINKEKVYWSFFKQVEIEMFLELVSSKGGLYAHYFDSIAIILFDDDSGKKSDLVKKIQDYIDYEGEFSRG